MKAIINTIRHYLTWAMVYITGVDRYRPCMDWKDMEWSDKSWTHNAFRFYEFIFARRRGIRPEMLVAWKEEGNRFYATVQVFSFEAFCAYTETLIRNTISVFVNDIQLVPAKQFQYALMTFAVFSFAFDVKIGTQFLPLFGLGIGFDTQTTTGPQGGSGASWTHTCTGANGMLLAAIGDQVGADPTSSSGATTYNSVSMSVISSRNSGTTAVAGWSLIAPTAGANTVNYTSAIGIFQKLGMSMSYTGCKQSSNPEAVSNAASATLTVTTLSANAWLAGFWCTTNATITAGANTTIRGQVGDGTNNQALSGGDTNAGQTPPGSFSINESGGSSPVGVVASLAEFAFVEIIPNPLTISGKLLMFYRRKPQMTVVNRG